MKKNLIFLTLLISVLMVSVVSAGITGYLVRGSGIRDAGYTATLQSVDRSGTATVAVTTPSGETNVVAVRENEAVRVGEATISASSLTRRNLFRRGGGNIGLNISNISGATQIKVPGASGGTGAVTGAHTHLVDWELTEVLFEYSSNQLQKAFNSSGDYIPLNTVLGNGEGFIQILPAGGNLYGKAYQLTGKCPLGKVVIGGGYYFSGSDIPYSSAVIQSADIAGENYYVNIMEPFEYSIQNGIVTESSPNVGTVTLKLSCARIEPTLHQFGQDY